MKNQKQRNLVVLALMGFLAAWVFSFTGIPESGFAEKFNSVAVGASEDAVIEILGEPDYLVACPRFCVHPVKLI